MLSIVPSTLFIDAHISANVIANRPCQVRTRCCHLIGLVYYDCVFPRLETSLYCSYMNNNNPVALSHLPNRFYHMLPGSQSQSEYEITSVLAHVPMFLYPTRALGSQLKRRLAQEHKRLNLVTLPFQYPSRRDEDCCPHSDRSRSLPVWLCLLDNSYPLVATRKGSYVIVIH
jgi:hypothetical protein